jgi:hypothetical protein
MSLNRSSPPSPSTAKRGWDGGTASRRLRPLFRLSCRGERSFLALASSLTASSPCLWNHNSVFPRQAHLPRCRHRQNLPTILLTAIRQYWGTRQEKPGSSNLVYLRSMIDPGPERHLLGCVLLGQVNDMLSFHPFLGKPVVPVAHRLSGYSIAPLPLPPCAFDCTPAHRRAELPALTVGFHLPAPKISNLGANILWRGRIVPSLSSFHSHRPCGMKYTVHISTPHRSDQALVSICIYIHIHIHIHTGVHTCSRFCTSYHGHVRNVLTHLIIPSWIAFSRVVKDFR